MANHCYLYRPVGKYVKVWNIELNRDEIKECTRVIRRQISRRGADSLDSVLDSLFGKGRNDAADNADAGKESGMDDLANALHERQRSDGAPNNSRGYFTLFRIISQIIL